MDKSQSLLSDLIFFTKYARHLPEKKRREDWNECVGRNRDMHLKKFGNVKVLREEIETAYELVRSKLILPSMRSMQFAGAAVEKNNARMFNCSFVKADSIEVFSEAFFLLLSGTGVGYSVQQHHTAKLPILKDVAGECHYLVKDSVEGWADAVKELFLAYTGKAPRPVFDYSDIRPKGTPLITSGGKAPGPEPLKKALETIEKLLQSVEGQRLRPIHVNDIICHLAEAVLSGGIRRSACICLFSHDDQEMLSAKSGNWYEKNPQRSKANNSVVLLRGTTDFDLFHKVISATIESGSGEPGIFWTSSYELGTNPCAEIALYSMQFCNLCTINSTRIKSVSEFLRAVKYATLIGTLQASYTDFTYLRPEWKETTEREALLGISLTGITSGMFGQPSELLFDRLQKGAVHATEWNSVYAKLIGINEAARITCVKPEGTSSLLLGTSSGIHPYYSEYFIRRIRVNKQEAVYQYLVSQVPELLEDDITNSETAVLSVPSKAPEGAAYRDEGAVSFLDRVSLYNSSWVSYGHRSGENKHNVSCTVNVKDNEWSDVIDWMWEHRNNYAGISMLPFSDHVYKQAPYEETTEDVYNDLFSKCIELDFRNVIEEFDNTEHIESNLACVGGACEL